MPQAVVLVLSSLVLDGGQIFRVCAIAALGYWIAVVVIMWRRPVSPTPTDLGFIRYGFWLLILLTKVIAPVVWRLVGSV